FRSGLSPPCPAAPATTAWQNKPGAGWSNSRPSHLAGRKCLGKPNTYRDSPIKSLPRIGRVFSRKAARRMKLDIHGVTLDTAPRQYVRNVVRPRLRELGAGRIGVVRIGVPLND